MEKNKSKTKNFIKKKSVWVTAIIVLIVAGYFFFRSSNNSANITTDTAKFIDLKETVLATGQVTSKTDLNLSFNTSGVVRRVNVAVGDKVSRGQVLATLDQSSSVATLTQARGALAAAEANLARTLAGASSEEITLAQVTLDQTRASQGTLVKNAYHNLLNSTPTATPEGGTSDYTAPTISGSYNGEQEGKIKINIYYTGSSSSFSVSGLTTGSGVVTTTTPQPIGDSGLYIKFPSTTNTITNWVITLPNKQAGDYLMNYNAYQNALSQSELAINQSVATLALKKSQARQPDIDLAQANITTAQGQVQAAQAKYNDTVVTAPASGTITRVDVKLGELAQALKEVMVLQDVSNIYLESNINEANISSLSIGMPVDVTYDAFGPEKVYKGKVTEIDPSSTLVSGVVNYKVTASMEATKDLRPGMTANMTIRVKEKNRVLTIPSRAILTDENTNKKTIRLITNPKTKAYKEVEITTGLEGDGGIVEVTSGLKEGDEFVVLVKK